MKKQTFNDSGVYGIFSPDGKILYIGGSTKIENRFNSHYSLLKNGNHSNIMLQEFSEHYRFENLTFIILMNCDINDVFYYEKYFINVFNPPCNKSNNILEPIKFKLKNLKPKSELELKFYDYIKEYPLSNEIRLNCLCNDFYLKTGLKISTKRISVFIKVFGYKLYNNDHRGRIWIK
jgi:hypothetical protein